MVAGLSLRGWRGRRHDGQPGSSLGRWRGRGAAPGSSFAPRRWRGRPRGGEPDSSFSIRRLLATLLLPASLLPVVLLAPSLARAPFTLGRRIERVVAPPHARVYPAPPEPQRYLLGAPRLEVDVFAPATGSFTPKVGVSPLDERTAPPRRAPDPAALIVEGPDVGSSP
jgi:hypothetical protein